MARGQYTSIGRGGGGGHGGGGHGGGHGGHGGHFRGGWGWGGWGGWGWPYWGGWGGWGWPYGYGWPSYYGVPFLEDAVAFPHWQSRRFFFSRNRRRIHTLLGG